jgi:hypothetical protein
MSNLWIEHGEAVGVKARRSGVPPVQDFGRAGGPDEGKSRTREERMIKSGLGGGAALVSFELPAAVSAASVSVCGDFNDWSPAAQPLARDEDGGFRAVIELPAGRRWRFRYLLDGQRWENDWAADDYIPNDHGSHDSVVDLTTCPPPLVSAEPAPATSIDHVGNQATPMSEPEQTSASSPADATTVAAPAAASSSTTRPAARTRKKANRDSNGKESPATAGTPAKTRKRVTTDSSGSQTPKTRARTRKTAVAESVTQLQVVPDPTVGAPTAADAPVRRRTKPATTE